MSTKLSSSRALRRLRYAHALFGGLITLFLAYIAVSAYVFTFFRVDGSSMYPTLQNHQIVPVFLSAYWFSSPQKNQIVIVQYAGEEHVRFVKRIVGLPGDTVMYQGSPLVLGSDMYFVMGDNRDHSTDSRTYGPIHRDQILGHVLHQ